jgi:hypothetical protein
MVTKSTLIMRKAISEAGVRDDPTVASIKRKIQ